VIAPQNAAESVRMKFARPAADAVSCGRTADSEI